MKKPKANNDGLASLGDALTQAGIKSAITTWARDAAEFFSVWEALSSGAVPCGELLREAQGQKTRELAINCARSLARRMRADGREVSQRTIDDGAGDAFLAIALWRRDGAAVAVREDPRQPGRIRKPFNQVAMVAWRAVVASMAHDTLADSVPLYRVDWDGEQTADADWLFVAALPMPGCEDIRERWTRRQIERARAKRLNLLARRMEFLAATGRGQGAARTRKAESVGRVHRAAILLLLGEPLDKAAELAGFKASGRKRAGEGLTQACKRLGLKLGQANLREPGINARSRLSI